MRWKGKVFPRKYTRQASARKKPENVKHLDTMPIYIYIASSTGNVLAKSCSQFMLLTQSFKNNDSFSEEQVGNLSSLNKKSRAETMLHCIYIQNKAES
jgi:hypothetical protein